MAALAVKPSRRAASVSRASSSLLRKSVNTASNRQPRRAACAASRQRLRASANGAV